MRGVIPVTRFAQVTLGFRPGTLIVDLDKTLFRDTAHTALCDPYAPGWIHCARQAGWRVMGCTARLSQTVHYTRMQLDATRIVLDPVLYTDGALKGPSVVKYLSSQGVLTGPVVVVDDLPEQLESIRDCVGAALPHIRLGLYQFCS